MKAPITQTAGIVQIMLLCLLLSDEHRVMLKSDLMLSVFMCLCSTLCVPSVRSPSWVTATMRGRGWPTVRPITTR